MGVGTKAAFAVSAERGGIFGRGLSCGRSVARSRALHALRLRRRGSRPPVAQAREVVAFRGDALGRHHRRAHERAPALLRDGRWPGRPLSGRGRQSGKRWAGRPASTASTCVPPGRRRRTSSATSRGSRTSFRAARRRNPMGEAALTLAGGEYAIHGTNVPRSVGGFVSYGCIRMYNRTCSTSIGASASVLPWSWCAKPSRYLRSA